MQHSAPLRKQILHWIQQYQAQMVSFLSRLVQCRTPSSPGGTRSAMALIQRFLSTREIACREISAVKTMPNLITSVKMGWPGRHLMFNGHLDVMPAGKEAGWTDDPWSGRVADGRVWGRSTSDMKAGVTAMSFAHTYLYRLRDHLSGRLSLTLVSDRETGWGRGTGYLFRQIPSEMTADCVLTGEPSGTDAVSFSSKGYMQLTVHIRTPGAIAGYSNQSRSAIETAAAIMQALKQLETLPVNLPEPLSGLLSDPRWRRQHAALCGKGHCDLLSKITWISAR